MYTVPHTGGRVVVVMCVFVCIAVVMCVFVCIAVVMCSVLMFILFDWP